MILVKIKLLASTMTSIIHNTRIKTLLTGATGWGGVKSKNGVGGEVEVEW